ncbi:MAG TPA: hypothetical protein VIV11_38535 [Kofleriaceae bacterium]
MTVVAVGIAVWALQTRESAHCPPQARIVERTPVAPPTPQWASSVRAFSSEYSDSSWSVQQALGAPDVYPRSGDIANAWASSEADAPTEFLEVAFATPQRMRALEIYETFNPGAITRVELITEQGTRIVEPRRELRRNGGAAVSTFGTTCTKERIVGARLVVDSGNVAGWNEVDAVALLPCQ